MLIVLSSARSSPIHGVGLFADEFIPKGTVTWRFDPVWDSISPKDDVEKLPETQRHLIKFFALGGARRSDSSLDFM